MLAVYISWLLTKTFLSQIPIEIKILPPKSLRVRPLFTTSPPQNTTCLQKQDLGGRVRFRDYIIRNNFVPRLSNQVFALRFDYIIQNKVISNYAIKSWRQGFTRIDYVSRNSIIPNFVNNVSTPKFIYISRDNFVLYYVINPWRQVRFT